MPPKNGSVKRRTFTKIHPRILDNESILSSHLRVYGVIRLKAAVARDDTCTSLRMAISLLAGVCIITVSESNTRLWTEEVIEVKHRIDDTNAIYAPADPYEGGSYKGPWVTADNRVILNPKVSPGAFRVYLNLRRYADHRGTCTKTLPELAGHCRMSTKQVRRLLRDLTDLGYIRLMSKSREPLNTWAPLDIDEVRGGPRC